MFPLQFLKGFLPKAYKICSECYIDEKNQFLIDVFIENGYERKTLEKITKNYLKVLQNPPVNNKDTCEDINKVVKLPWIPIIGFKLKQVFKKKNNKTCYIRPKFKIVVMLKQDKAVP